MENIYVTGEYLAKNATLHIEDSQWKSKHILRMLEKHHLRPLTLVEVGCGAGEILKQLQDHLSEDTHFEGYDVSPQGIEIARQRENDRLHFFCQDLTSLGDHAYDVVLCIDVFEHVEDYMGFLRTLHKKGTYKLFHIPIDLTLLSLLRNVPVHRRETYGHLHYFTKDTAMATLQDTGYEIIDWWYTAPIVDHPKTLGQKLLKVPRKIAFRIDQDITVRLIGGYSLLVLAK